MTTILTLTLNPYDHKKSATCLRLEASRLLRTSNFLANPAEFLGAVATLTTALHAQTQAAGLPLTFFDIQRRIKSALMWGAEKLEKSTTTYIKVPYDDLLPVATVAAGTEITCTFQTRLTTPSLKTPTQFTLYLYAKVPEDDLETLKTLNKITTSTTSQITCIPTL